MKISKDKELSSSSYSMMFLLFFEPNENHELLLEAGIIINDDNLYLIYHWKDIKKLISSATYRSSIVFCINNANFCFKNETKSLQPNYNVVSCETISMA